MYKGEVIEEFSKAEMSKFYKKWGRLKGEQFLEMLENGSVPFLKGYSRRKILAIPKGQRPNPSVYLPKEYTLKHLNLFDEGVIRFTSKISFQERGTLGPIRAFVLPKKDFDEIIIESKGEMKILEKLLGFDEGYLEGDDVMIAYFEKNDIKDLRMPSGNERGANERWVPGGYTSGNIPEAVVDLNKKVKFK